MSLPHEPSLFYHRVAAGSIDLLFISLGYATGQGMCTFGDSVEDQTTSSSPRSGTLFLDIDNPSPCSGSITSWHFCHYEQSEPQDRIYTALVQIWRPQEEMKYMKVSETSLSETIARRSSGFECVNVTEQTSIPVSEGDILAVYIPGSRGLRMVSENLSNNRLFYIEPGSDVSQVTEVMITEGQMLDNHELHLTAEIGKIFFIAQVLTYLHNYFSLMQHNNP